MDSLDNFKRRSRFQQGEQSGGKGVFDFYLSGDPDFESGVKTHLLREQNKLLKEAREEAKKAQAKAEWNELREESLRESQNGIRWLLGYPEHEKKWKSLTKVANVTKLSDEKLLDHYQTLSKEVDSLKRARYDAGRGNYPDEIGVTTQAAYDNVASEHKRRSDESLNRYVESLGEENNQLLKGIETLSQAFSAYLGAYGDKTDEEARMKKVGYYAQRAVSDIDQLLATLTPSACALLEEKMGVPLTTIKTELQLGPKLGKAYFDAHKQVWNKIGTTWIVAVIAFFAMLLVNISLPWFLYILVLATPIYLQFKVFPQGEPKHLDEWTKHVSQVVQYGKQTLRVFESIWSYPYRPTWASASFSTPKSVTGS